MSAKGSSSGRPSFDPKRVRAEETEPNLFSAAAPPESQDVPAPSGEPPILTVTALNRKVRGAIRKDLPGVLRVLGEISNLSRPSGGHVYFTLKDEASEIRSVMWRSDSVKLRFEPKDGQEIIATGEVDVFEPRGQYQFYVRRLEPRGVGALELAFRQLRERLEKEGLFEPGRKRPIPRFPRRVAVVTSPTGAAIRDILQTIQRRFPCIEIIVFPVKVQGEGAAAEIADAIRRLNTNRGNLGGVDVMIVGRGGGSLEDLWAFNEEVVARAIFASEIPVISAVGHEVDFTIADFVADLRAATPTAAAELVVPHSADLAATIDAQTHRMARAVARFIEQARGRLALAERSEWFRDPLSRIAQRQQMVDEATGRLGRAAEKLREVRRMALHELEVRLIRVRPQALLAARREAILKMEHRLHWGQQQRLSTALRDLESSRFRLRTAAGLRVVDRGVVQLAALKDRLALAVATELNRRTSQVQHLETRLQAGSHEQVLKRGFTITRRAVDGRVVTNSRDARPNDELLTQTADGTIASQVSPKHGDSPDDARRKSQ